MRKNNKVYHGKTLAEWTAKAVCECYLQEKKDGLEAGRMAAARPDLERIAAAKPDLHNFYKEKSTCK